MGGFGLDTLAQGISNITNTAIHKPIERDAQGNMMREQMGLGARYSMDLANFNTKKQYEMWLLTQSPVALERLGLNPGLVYGKGGAGGATAASGEIS